MGRKLSQMSTPQVREELSIAGNPDKIMGMHSQILGIMGQVDSKNAAELINLEFIMQRLLAENRVWVKIYESRTGQKITTK
jgi:hypothetical protein